LVATKAEFPPESQATSSKARLLGSTSRLSLDRRNASLPGRI
jgi:hypothetical protein